MKYKFLLYVFSPTFFYAEYKKMKLDEQLKARFIIKKNKEYFIFSLSTFVLFIIYNSLESVVTRELGITNINYLYPLFFILFYYYFSRVNEIFLSFLFDVLEKLKNQYKLSYISFRDRIKLAFFSYLELIINYSMMYWIIYISFGLFNKGHLHLINFLYYSCGTIATLGFGDIYATHFIPQLLSVYEVFNGMLLVIVCFTIYVALNFKKDLYGTMEGIPSIPNDEKVKADYIKFKSMNKGNFIIAISLLFVIYIIGFFIITSIFPTNSALSFIIYTIFTFLVVLILKKRGL